MPTNDEVPVNLNTWKTNISLVHNSEMDIKGIYCPASIDIEGSRKPEKISWFDKLLEGGLKLPKTVSNQMNDRRNIKPITMLIMGPPGSGKSTLAMEICYRLALEENNENILNSLYISLDTESGRVMEKVNKFGWVSQNHTLWGPYSERKNFRDNFEEIPRIMVWGKDQILKKKNQYSDIQQIAEVVSEAINTVATIADIAGVKGAEIIPPITNTIQNRFHPKTQTINNYAPDILVIDSLNITKAETRSEYFDQFLKITDKGSRLVIYILDSNSADGQHEYWEYVCDNVIRMDYTYVHDYFIRTIEITKTRYQGHVLGKQQLKIYEKPSMSVCLKDITDIQRQHPFTTEGGIFIFPSIHYYLSIYKRRKPAPASETIKQKYPRFFKELIEYPKGRCTAFIGQRGGHKSHLAYLSLLCHLIDPKTYKMNQEERGLVISLRDDEEMTLETMNRILKQEFEGKCKFTAKDLLQENRLEILYYRPGYITPEEFFHRMFISIHHLKYDDLPEPNHSWKGSKHNVMLVFNSLDQLPARFPLCAKQEIFIPGIIDTICAEEITSIFIAVDEPDQPIDKFGLLPMADLILSFNRKSYHFQKYLNYIKKWHEIKPEKLKKIIERLGDQYRDREVVILEVMRASGGKSAGDKGILELIKDPEFQLYEEPGLQFTPMSPNDKQQSYDDENLLDYPLKSSQNGKHKNRRNIQKKSWM